MHDDGFTLREKKDYSYARFEFDWQNRFVAVDAKATASTATKRRQTPIGAKPSIGANGISRERGHTMRHMPGVMMLDQTIE